MNVLLDINVLLDVFLNRAPWGIDSAEVFRAHHLGKIRGFISAAALPTVFYIARRQAGLPQAFQVVDACLNSFDIALVQRSTVELARTRAGSDFEDDLLIAAAMEVGLDAIVTRDAAGFAHGPIVVHSPADLLRMLPEGSGKRSTYVFA